MWSKSSAAKKKRKRKRQITSLDFNKNSLHVGLNGYQENQRQCMDSSDKLMFEYGLSSIYLKTIVDCIYISYTTLCERTYVSLDLYIELSAFISKPFLPNVRLPYTSTRFRTQSYEIYYSTRTFLTAHFHSIATSLSK